MSVSNIKPNEGVDHKLEIRRVFDSLIREDEAQGTSHTIYAHHLARACWHGTRIMLRQTSLEAEGIFDFIIELHRACNGRWTELCDRGIKREELEAWLDFAGMFLSSMGNYFDAGDRKVIPGLSREALKKMSNISPEASTILEKIIDLMMSNQPSNLWYPSETSQSRYYLGEPSITKEEIEAVTKIMEARNIAPENTRLLKTSNGSSSTTEESVKFEILQASSEQDDVPQLLETVQITDQRSAKVYLRRGDHSREMTKICTELSEGRKYAMTEEQRTALDQLIKSFRTGDYEAFRSAHKTWVKDKAPRVEHCMGFLFGYRDPFWMRRLVNRSVEFIRTLPWAVPGENDGKGPFEPSELDIPDFAIIHVLASVSCTVWEATNITIDDDNGKRHGVKNMVYGNRLSLNSSPGRPCYYIHPSEAEAYMSCAHIVHSIATAIHELIGHGTGKLLAETLPGIFNFDNNNPPTSPVTGGPINTWYRPGETWNSVFGKLASTVEECRAFLVADYLVDNKDILDIFGYDQNSTPLADDLVYYSYLKIGVEGLLALCSFQVENRAWGGDHDQAQFAIFKHILQDGDVVMWIEHDPVARTLFVRVDRSKIVSHGKPSLGRMLKRIHIWRSTADMENCRPFYDLLSAVDGEYDTWRQIVISNPEPKWKFVLPNTFLNDDGAVELKEYDRSNLGIIQSFYERDL